MKEGGWALVGLGVLLILAGLFVVDVSADIGYVPSGSPYVPSMPREVANLHAMHIQTLLVHGGIGSIICGTLAIGFGTLDERFGAMLETISRRSRNAPAETSSEADAAAPATEPGVQSSTDEEESDASHGMLIGFGIAAAIIILIIMATTSSDNSDTYNAAAVNQAVQDASDHLNELNSIIEGTKR